MLHMPQSDRSRELDEPLQAPEGQGGIGELVNFALALLRRQYALILFAAVLGLAASLIYLSMIPPTYTGQVKLLFENPKLQLGQQQSILTDSLLDRGQLESHLQILTSKAVLASVVSQLKLAEDPDFKPSTQPLARVFRRMRALLGAEPAQQVVEPASESDALVAALDGRLVAERFGFSNIVEIRYSSSNPTRAAEVANAVANAYIVDQLNAKFEAKRTATTWLQERLRDLGQQALTAERAVSAFRSEHNVVAAGGRLMDEQQVTDLNTRLVAARAQTSDAQARLSKFRAILGSSDVGPIAANANLDASVSDSSIVTNLRQQYLEYARREAEWSTRFGKDHLAVINVRNKMRDMRTSILDEVRRLAEASKSDYELAKQRQADVEKQLAQAVAQSRATNSAESTLRELETNAKGYRSLYESFLQRYMGAVQQESFPITEARIISPASPSQSKSKRKTAFILALGLFGGLALGTGIGLLRHTMERVFRTAAHVEAVLHVPCLSLVPLLKEVEPKQLPRELQKARTIGQRIIERRSGVFWAATEMPFSNFAESIRSIKLAVDLGVTSTSNKVVGITSSLPNEGKSTIAAALALLMAHAGARVIVVDCDLRNASLSRSLAPNASAGLIEVIAAMSPLQDAIWRDPSTSLAFLPIVKKKPIFHTCEVLSSLPTKQLFDKLRASYDYVVVDLPPLAPIVDVRAMAPLMDCFILAVEWAGTKTDVVQHALHNAPNVHEALIGAVLSKTDMRAIRRYDNYHGDYYSNEQFGRYRVDEAI
jgi:succinoglycan biosynthesis transport protein ExoP